MIKARRALYHAWFQVHIRHPWERGGTACTGGVTFPPEIRQQKRRRHLLARKSKKKKKVIRNILFLVFFLGCGTSFFFHPEGVDSSLFAVIYLSTIFICRGVLFHNPVYLHSPLSTPFFSR